MDYRIIPPTKIQLCNQSKISTIHSASKHCIFCDIEFDYGRRNKQYCDLCYIKAICPICGKEFVLYPNKLSGQTYKYIIPLIQNKQDIKIACSKKCAISKTIQTKIQPGNCIICGKFSEIRDAFGKCKKCAGKQRLKIALNHRKSGNCTTCGKYYKYRDCTGMCPECRKQKVLRINYNRKLAGICVNCGKYVKERNTFSMCLTCATNHNIQNLNEIKDFSLQISCNPNCDRYNDCNKKDSLKNKWGWCKESPNLTVTTSFNREEFYNFALDIINYTSLEQMISDFDALLSIPGVWAVKCNDAVLDVCETQDIGNEMYQALRHLNFMKGKTDDEIQTMNNFYNRRKVRDIANEGQLDFVLVTRDIDDKSEREKMKHNMLMILKLSI